MTDDKREALAALEHEQWAHWTRYMLKTLEPLLSPNLRWHPDVRENAEAALERWKRQINTPYADLSEKEKDSDREWADKVLEITGTASPLDGSVRPDKVIEVRGLIKTQGGPPLIWSGTWRGTAIQFRYRWGSWSISTGGASVFAKDREFLYGGKGTRDGVETSTYDATCTWDEFVGWARDAGVTIRVIG